VGRRLPAPEVIRRFLHRLDVRISQAIFWICILGIPLVSIHW
jgi:hypothetical protein